MVGEQMGFNIHYESVADNPYLDDFYENMKRWSFNIQIHFLTHRFNSHQKIQAHGASAIQDRTIYEDCAIFARALYEQGDMTERDFNTYKGLNEIMSRYLNPPDLLIYLRKSVPNLLQNIQKRSRDCENNIPLDYLARLNNYYDDWIESYEHGRVITIESDGLDFVKNPADFDYILDQIREALPQPELFTPNYKVDAEAAMRDDYHQPEQQRLV